MWHSWPVEVVWQVWGRVKNLFINFLPLFCLRGESCHVLFPWPCHLYVKSLSEIVPVVSATTAGDYQNHGLFLPSWFEMGSWAGRAPKSAMKRCHQKWMTRQYPVMRSCPIPGSSSCPWLCVSSAEILSPGLIPPLVFSCASIWHQGRRYARCNCGRSPWKSPLVLGICL